MERGKAADTCDLDVRYFFVTDKIKNEKFWEAYGIQTSVVQRLR